ncbi:5-oxoprolinase subunit B/C family protein [Microbacterium sp. NPDC055683]
MRRVLVASDTAYLVEEDDAEGAWRLHAALAAETPAGVVEVVAGARTVLVRFRKGTGRGLRELLATIPGRDPGAAAGSVVALPVVYDGDDLEAVADLLGASPDAVATRHAAAEWRVAFAGFAPGFAYLVADDPLFDVPRRASPRTRVPAGSVALAGPYSGVYPRASPGGWQLIGRTDAVLWDPDREPAALLAPGASVRFLPARDVVAASARDPDRALRHGSSRVVDMPGDRRVAPAVVVVEPGLQLLVEDAGRAGRAAMGVSPSGAADRTALHDANVAVGNDPGEAALELLLGGAVLRFRAAGVAAIAGAPVDALLVRGDDAHPLDAGRPFAVADGDELRIGHAERGLRAYIAIRGGLALVPVLGSLATDLLGGIGPRELGGRALRAGDVLPLRGPSAARRLVEPWAAPARALRAPGEVAELRVVLGPRADRFARGSLRRLFADAWTVTPRSDRTGVRLHGAHPLVRTVESELPSEGVAAGAVQVPSDGQPVLFLADHPVTGGYPVVAAVIDDDLDLAGQLPPGALVRFRPV